MVDGEDKRMIIISRDEALSLGLKKYFTGQQCKYGHISERYTKHGECVTCVKLRADIYKKKYPEKAREAVRKWAKTLEKERSKRRQSENPERFREYSKKYRMNHPEKVVELNRKYYAEHREQEINRVKKRWKENPEARNLLKRNYYARKKNSHGTHTLRDIEGLKKVQLNTCNMCLVNLDKTGYHVDHIMPLARGGHNGPENLQLLCPHCNRIKGMKDPVETIGWFLEHPECRNQ